MRSIPAQLRHATGVHGRTAASEPSLGSAPSFFPQQRAPAGMRVTQGKSPLSCACRPGSGSLAAVGRNLLLSHPPQSHHRPSWKTCFQRVPKGIDGQPLDSASRPRMVSLL